MQLGMSATAPSACDQLAGGRARTWKVGGMMTGVGEPATGFLSPRSEGGTGDGLMPSTWKPTTCVMGTDALVPWSLRRLSMAPLAGARQPHGQSPLGARCGALLRRPAGLGVRARGWDDRQAACVLIGLALE